MNRTSAPAWLASVGMVTAVVALWQPSTSISAGARYLLAVSLPGWAFVMPAVSSLTVLLAIVALVITTPRRKDPANSEPKPPRALRLSPLALIMLITPLASLVAAVAVALRLADSDLLAAWRGFVIGMTAPPPGDVANRPDIMDMPEVDLGMAAAVTILSIAVTGFALLAILVHRPGEAIAGWLHRPRGRGRSLADVSSGISAAARELELGDDPRSAVIACYRRCEMALANRGRLRYTSETPREFLHDALTALALPANALRSLLLVFERARFSDLTITQKDRSVALDALSEIGAALESRNRNGERA
jgi:Domain of unknown function (DUF4129)